jgi:hypothetical protein
MSFVIPAGSISFNDFLADYVKCKCGNEVKFHYLFTDCNRKRQDIIHKSFPFWTCVATGKLIEDCSSELLIKVLSMQLRSLCRKRNDIVPEILKRIEFAKKGNLDVYSYISGDAILGDHEVHLKLKLYCIVCDLEKLDQELGVDMICINCKHTHGLCDNCNEACFLSELNSDNECEDCVSSHIEAVMEAYNDQD